MAQTQIIHTFSNIILMSVHLKDEYVTSKQDPRRHMETSIKSKSSKKYSMLHVANGTKCTHQYQKLYVKRKSDAKVKQLRNGYDSQLVLNYNVNLVNFLFLNLNHFN